MQKRALVHLVSGLVLAALALSACARGQETEPKADAEMQEVAFTATDYKFEGPATVKGGLSSLTLDNTGAEAHMAGILKLNPGATLQKILDAAKTSPSPDAPFFQNAVPAGGLAAIDPGQSTKVVQRLDAGSYIMVCFVPSPDGVSHFAKGMVQELTVEGSAPAATEPEADGTIMLKDFSISLPDAATRGTGTFKVTNDGPQPHEAQLLKLAPGRPSPTSRHSPRRWRPASPHPALLPSALPGGRR